MAEEMRMPVELGVAVGGEHLAVRVHVDVLAGRLLEQVGEVLEVVARHQDRLVGPVAEGHFGRYRVPIGARVGRVEQFHHPQVDPAGLHREIHPLVDAQGRIRQRSEGLVDETRHLRVRLPQDPRMIRVGRDALHAVYRQLLQRPDVDADGALREVPRRPRLSHNALRSVVGHEVERTIASGGRTADGRDRLRHTHAMRVQAAHDVFERCGIEVHVRDRVEDGLGRIGVGLGVKDSEASARVRP